METFSRLLVAVDGSAPAKSATGVALQIAAQRHDVVTFVSVFDLGAAAADCDRVLDEATEQARLAGVDPACVLRGGSPVDQILAEADKLDASCIVMGTHGREGLARTLMGSCAEGVLRRSRIPVLVTHAGTSWEARSVKRLLVAIDDSPAAAIALDAAAALARAWSADLRVLSVVPLPDDYVARYEATGSDPEGSLTMINRSRLAALTARVAKTDTEGIGVVIDVAGAWDVAARIVADAQRTGCDLIVIGTHGRDGIRRLIVGSTAEAVLRASTVPVLIFRDPREQDIEAVPEGAAVSAS